MLARLLPTSLVIVIVVACAGGDEGDAVDLPPLLMADDLGAGWIASEAAPVPLTPAAVAPPCPFSVDIPEIVVAAADSTELSNEREAIGIVHTVVELDGDLADDDADAVVRTWATMDCSASDFDQSPVAGLPGDVVGVRLSAREGTLTQVVVVRADGPTMSFLVVSGDGDAPVEIARELA